ncbi:MAG: PorT family protein [Bacteroidales bacterium]|nr:PorT family protein [Bacteroidales bacterium]
MKKLTIIALFVSTLVFVSNVHAQDEGRFGVKAGLNLANMSIGDDADNSMRTGLHAGFMAKVPLTEKVALQPELIYSRKGTDIKYDADFLGIDLAEGETNVRFDYIDIPIYLVFNPVENFNVHAGPYLGLLLGAQVDTQAEILEGIDINDEDDIDIDHFNSTEFGLSGGIAFEFDRVSLGVNYNWGLSQIAKDDDVSETLIGDAKNRVLQVYLGFLF